MTAGLIDRVAAGLAAPVLPEVEAFAARLAAETGAGAILFYGSNLRTGELDGVLDFYALTSGPVETGIWPRVSYHEWQCGSEVLRAKLATMHLATFRAAAAGKLLDTTIWTRFCQPCALVWQKDEACESDVKAAVGVAAITAARLAVALGPERGREQDFWRLLFRATYRAEFRMEKRGREDSILGLNRGHFEGLLPLALNAASVRFAAEEHYIAPILSDAERGQTLRWWRRRRRLGKLYNAVRLVRASATFHGAARYAAWKIERHTGIKIKLTPWREKHPLLAAPGVLWHVWRSWPRQRA